MIYSIFADKDTTLYEFTNGSFSLMRNTGMDSILELEKVIFYGTNTVIGNVTSSFSGSVAFNSRILIKFDTSDILNLVGNATSSAKYYLNLYSSKMQAIPLDYTIMVHPVSGSWDMGTGNKYDSPAVSNGASWYYRDSKNMSTVWATGSLSQNISSSIMSGTVDQYGGGTWYTGSQYDCSQSFYNETTDLRVDVTKIVNLWLTNSIDNNGFLVKKSDSSEQNIDYYSSFAFFSQDTNTIYLPKLEVTWDDSRFTTGSLTPAVDDEIILYFKNLKKDYQQKSKAKMRVAVRDVFPEKNYMTSGSQYKAIKYLPTSSYYSVRDAATEDVVIPFDTESTKISCDSEGNYFNIWFNGLQPERIYRFIIRTELDSQEVYFDNNYIFKVKR